MSASVTRLPDRHLLEIGGEDCASFLQGLLTNDVESLTPGEGRFAALLSPQGKILFDFFVLSRGDAFLIDAPAALRSDLAKRLTLYRLRVKVTIAEASGHVFAAWGEGAAEWAKARAPFAFADPRLPALGFRAFLPASVEAHLSASLADYDAHRIALSIPEGGKDYAYGETFPHDACLDLLDGVSFKKGCFVGQEVVSRMQHRGTARTRVLAVSANAPLPQEGAEIVANGLGVGRLGSASGERGIALARLDRVKDALAKGSTFSAGGVPVALDAPAWANYSLFAAAPGAAH